MEISEALAAKGHHITIVSSYESMKRNRNITEITLATNHTSETLLSTVFEEGAADMAMREIFFKSPELCVETLSRREMQELRNQSFDLIMISMFFNYCYLYYVDYFKVPFIYVSPAGLFSAFSEIVGNIELPSIVPNKLLDATFPATFVQRVQSTFLNTLFATIFPHYLQPTMFELCLRQKICPPEMPSFNSINNNVSLVIINSIQSLEYPPRPTMPNIIYAGGIHTRPPNNLSEDIEKWVNGSGEHGFILFSLGSAFEPSVMPKKYKKILLKVFGCLKQRVLWKFNKIFIPNLPKNVKLMSWLPQQDILGHPKIRLFITHGGLFSTQEATYHGVPIIGMPLFADQFSNMREAEREGWAQVMTWDDLEEKSFTDLLQHSINNKSMRMIAKGRARLMRDRPLTPKDEVTFWIEYVIRHGGATHLKSPLLIMKWYQIYNLDIWLSVVLLLLILMYLCWRLFIMTVHLLLGLGKKEKSQSKTKWE
ncbi:UNVERIFIED_CONTAM: hypothetical protein RMT77_011866 [Armadillidium vulgare]